MTTLEIRQQKKQIREECKKIRKSIEKQHKEELDRKICDAIISSVSFHYADTVLLFYPLENEINLLPVFDEALKQGKKVAFPKCMPDRRMEFFYVSSLCELKKGKYNICEPQDVSDENKFDTSCHPLCIVPCLAATKNGERLGYGAGYYDRFLHKFSGISGVVQYEMLVFDTLVQEKRYDKKTDLLITEKGVSVVG